MAAHLELGRSDADYRSCNGAVFFFAGGSVEIGSPYFVEIGGDVMEVGGDDCAPAIRTAGGEILTPEILKPHARYSIGPGRRMARDRVIAVARIGLLTTSEPWISVKATASSGHVTLGFEFGQIRAKWRFENNPAADFSRWSSFYGISIGLRL